MILNQWTLINTKSYKNKTERPDGGFMLTYIILNGRRPPLVNNSGRPEMIVFSLWTISRCLYSPGCLSVGLYISIYVGIVVFYYTFIHLFSSFILIQFKTTILINYVPWSDNSNRSWFDTWIVGPYNYLESFVSQSKKK